MTQSDKQKVEFDERFGKCLWYDVYDDGETAPILVAIMEQKGTKWLDIRRMYWTAGAPAQLGFGKGVRIELANDKALDVLGMAQAGVTVALEELKGAKTDEDVD